MKGRNTARHRCHLYIDRSEACACASAAVGDPLLGEAGSTELFDEFQQTTIIFTYFDFTFNCLKARIKMYKFWLSMRSIN